jgi:hypothetical protein
MKTMMFIMLLMASACAPEVAPSNSEAKNLKLDDKRVLILVDGKETTSAELNAIDVNKIDSMSVIKGVDEVKKFTTKDYEGVIVVSLKK